MDGEIASFGSEDCIIFNELMLRASSPIFLCIPFPVRNDRDLCRLPLIERKVAFVIEKSGLPNELLPPISDNANGEEGYVNAFPARNPQG